MMFGTAAVRSGDCEAVNTGDAGGNGGGATLMPF